MYNLNFSINGNDLSKRNIQDIIVPGEVRYLSEWDQFRFSNFPDKFILDKKIPGCGFTEYCLSGLENVILCSPRKMLLENKKDQHQEVYLVVNELDKDAGVDKDINKVQKSGKEEVDKNQQSIVDLNNTPGYSFLERLSNIVSLGEIQKSIYHRLYNEIYNYCLHCYNNRRQGQFMEEYQPIKILVTYDSYGLILQILEDVCQRIDRFLFGTFYTVVDEFQSILHDARFKSSTEIEFMSFLQRTQKVMFVSATPLLDRYMALLPEFDWLPYFRFDWEKENPTRIAKPDLKSLTMSSVGTKAEEIIEKYLNKKFDKAYRKDENGNIIEIVSDELVLYVNSVNHIISIIKKLNLQPDQVNILCANTEENKKKIRRKLGKGYTIGKIPKKGEKPKMFTFCTRTVYLGADFYSLCAQTVIFSDANSDCLAVDISDDLPQILGRQRLEENPWKNKATLYYRYTADYNKMTQEDFENIIKKKEKTTIDLLRAFESAPEDVKGSLAINYKENAQAYNYKNNYVAVNSHAGSIPMPVFNNLVLANELRAFYIQQFDYADRISVFTSVHNNFSKTDVASQEAVDFFEKYKTLTTLRGKLKLLCESGLSKNAIEIVLNQIGEQDCIKSYYKALGPDRLRALGYNKTYIDRELGIKVFSQELLKEEVYSSFHEGEKYPLTSIKTKLGDIYSDINYKATPKATDLKNWFEVREIKVSEIDSNTGIRKQSRGYELLKSKE